MTYEFLKLNSPIGDLFLIGHQTHLVSVVFETNQSQFKKYGAVECKKNPILLKASKQLNEYFQGKRKTFDLPLDLTGTDFQKSVWTALEKIPYGQTTTYQEQSILIKKPTAMRAVGRTNGLNPLAIILPCHRVIGKSGKLTGYAGGLEVKKQLLALEQKNNPDNEQIFMR
ncbi:MAG: methylated-DNA--[protein]-cysteine S-methyltransferase [Pseudobdellovibrionaceae bacterium]